MGNNSLIEVKRQLFHMFMGVAIVILIRLNLLDLKRIGILLFIGFILSILCRKYKIYGISWFLKHLERENNIRTFPGKGALFYLMGVFFALLLFREDVALASIMIMAFGDSVATLFGMQQEGRLKHPFSSRKYLEGSLVGGIAGFFGAMLFVSPIYAFVSSMIAMIIEGIDIKLGFTHVDDNLVIPVAAGLIITVLELIFG